MLAAALEHRLYIQVRRGESARSHNLDFTSTNRASEKQNACGDS